MELYLGFVLFACKSNPELVRRMNETLGAPPEEIYTESERYLEYYTPENQLIELRSSEEGVSSSSFHLSIPSGGGSNSQVKLSNLLQNDALFLDFISKILHYDPDARLSPTEALTHPFLFPSSYDLYYCFLDQVNVEDEKAELKQQFKEEERKFIELHNKEIKKLEKEIESQREKFNIEHKKVIEKLKKDFEFERETSLADYEIEIGKLKRDFEEEREEFRTKFHRIEENMNKKLNDERSQMYELHQEKLHSHQQQQTEAKEKISLLENQVEDLKSFLNSASFHQEETQTSKATKRKAVPDTQFEEYVKARRASKEHRTEQATQERVRLLATQNSPPKPSQVKRNVFGGSCKAARDLLKIL